MTSATVGSIVSAELADLAEKLLRSLVAVRGSAQGLGSGLAVAEDLVVTNDHVARADEVEVVDRANRTLGATVIARLQEADLALLRVSGGGFEPAALRTVPAARPGELVIAVGNPHGQRGAVTLGNVVAGPRQSSGDSLPLKGAIVADVRLAPGNSGGPLADASGRVLGITGMVSGGMAVAVPSAAVEQLLAEAAAPAVRGFLGLSGRLVAVEAVASPAGALLVSEVDPEGPADAAGLVLGDLIIAVGEAVSPEPVDRQLKRLRAGEAVQLEVLRGGESRRFSAIPRAA